MISNQPTCPYCNSPALIPAGTAAGQRVPCPRCGESFPYRGPGAEALAARPATPPSAPDPPAEPRPLSNRKVAATVLGVMLVMAGLALAYALHTVMVRRGYDLHLPKSQAVDVPLYARIALGVYAAALVTALVWGWNRREAAPGGGPWRQRLTVPALGLAALVGFGLALLALQGRPAREAANGGGAEPVRRVPPADLPELGYLPDDTNGLVAVHVAEALHEPVGRQVLARLNFGDVGVQGLEGLTGLKLDDLEHVVLGLKLDDLIPPRMTLVAQTRRPYDPGAVRAALKADRGTPQGGRTLHHFQMPGFGLDAYVWFADERTLVVARRLKDFERVPRTPHPGLDHLPAELQGFLKTRMGPAAQVWAVGHADGWDKVKVAQLGLALLYRTDVLTLFEAGRVLPKLRTAGAWLVCGDGVTLRAAFACADEASAKALARYFTPDDEQGRKTLEALGMLGKQPLPRALGETLKTVQEGSWVELQAKAGAEAVRSAADRPE
jgi:hypothetical protein